MTNEAEREFLNNILLNVKWLMKEHNVRMSDLGRLIEGASQKRMKQFLTMKLEGHSFMTLYAICDYFEVAVDDVMMPHDEFKTYQWVVKS